MPPLRWPSAFLGRVAADPESNLNRARRKVIVPAPSSRSGCLRKRNSLREPVNPQIVAALLIALRVSSRLKAVLAAVAQEISRSEPFLPPSADRDPAIARGNAAPHPKRKSVPVARRHRQRTFWRSLTLLSYATVVRAASVHCPSL